MTTGLHAPIGSHALHVTIDMQVIFDSHPDWGVADLRRILPQVLRLTTARPERTVCTRFVPPRRPADAAGSWQRYFQHWQSATLDRAGLAAVDLAPGPAAVSGPPAVD